VGAAAWEVIMAEKHAFAGSIPENYQRYLVPLLFEDYARQLAAGTTAPAGSAVLETACGTGVVTRELARTLPAGARLVATDVNEAMLRVARELATESVGGGPLVEFRAADGTDLPFPDAMFDTVVCQFGVMFFPDRVRGYSEARRVLREGGRFRFSVWDALETAPLAHRTHEIVTAMFPQSPPSFLGVPWSYHDADLIRRELQSAGFEDITITRSEQPSRAPAARDVAMAFGAGSPLGPQLAERGDLEAIITEIAGRLEETFGAGPIEAPMRALIVEARV